MNIFGIGLPEMALILVVALLVFGPKKLPEVGRSLAQALGSFKKAQQEFEAELKRESAEIEKTMKAPIKAEIAQPDAKALPQDDAPVADAATEAAVEESTTDAATADETEDEVEVASDASAPST